MTNENPTINPPSKKSLFLFSLLVGLTCAIAITIILSYVVYKFTLGGPGLGYLIFVPFVFLFSWIGNIIVGAILTFGFGHQLKLRGTIIILIALNLIVVAIYSTSTITTYVRESKKASDTEARYILESNLSQNARSLTECDQITKNYYYWTGCLASAREYMNTTKTSQAGSLAICLQQAQQKHFSYQPQDPATTCHEFFTQ